MSEAIDQVLERLPASTKVAPAVFESLDKQIRDGFELNALQRETVLGAAKFFIEQGQAPAPLEAFFSYAYTELTEDAKTSEEGKKQLANLVRVLKSNGAVASGVARLAQEVVQKREKRRSDLTRFLQSVANSEAGREQAKKDKPREPAKVFVRKMQAARMGVGDNPMPNYNLAVTIAEDAVTAYPNTPLVLFEAAGCYQILADKGKDLATTERYVHLRQAFTLYQRCYECLTTEPYVKLKGEYDKWRSGTANLIVRIQKELERLQELQEKQK